MPNNFSQSYKHNSIKERQTAFLMNSAAISGHPQVKKKKKKNFNLGLTSYKKNQVKINHGQV